MRKHRYIVGFKLDGVYYASDAMAWNKGEAMQMTADRLAGRPEEVEMVRAVRAEKC